MENNRLIDLTTPLDRDFSDYFLTKNPFPSIGVPEEFPSITVDRENVIVQFRETVSEVLKNNNSILTVTVGEYGSGKSHLLKLFKMSVNHHLLFKENGALAGYVKSPGNEFLDFVLSFFDNVGREELYKITANYIKRYLSMQNVTFLSDVFYDKNIIDKILVGNFDIDEIENNPRYQQLLRRILDDRFKHLDYIDVARALLFLTHPIRSNLCWKWFLGYDLSRKERDDLSMSFNIDNDNALRIFLTFKEILKTFGIENLVILIDELEKIVTLRSDRRDKYQDDFRQLIDECASNTIIYFSMAIRQWEELTSETSAFVRRLQANWQILDEFEDKHIEELIERYLYEARTYDFSSNLVRQRFHTLDPILCPFSKDSINKIQELTEGVVSRILILCKKSLDYLTENKDIFPYITPELVEEAFKKRY